MSQMVEAITKSTIMPVTSLRILFEFIFSMKHIFEIALFSKNIVFFSKIVFPSGDWLISRDEQKRDFTVTFKLIFVTSYKTAFSGFAKMFRIY